MFLKLYSLSQWLAFIDVVLICRNIKVSCSQKKPTIKQCASCSAIISELPIPPPIPSFEMLGLGPCIHTSAQPAALSHTPPDPHWHLEGNRGRREAGGGTGAPSFRSGDFLFLSVPFIQECFFARS